MSKKLIVGDEVYDYPDTGDGNYGENATGWAEDITSIAAEVRGPGDLPTQKTTNLKVGADDGDYITGTIKNLKFDTAYVQNLTITGFITRTYSDVTPTQIESFTIKGSYDGTQINFTVDYSGKETELEFTVTAGQFSYRYLKLHPDQDTAGPTLKTDTIIIKFQAKTQVDEAYFE